MEKILIVDDEKSIRKTFTAFLENADYRVVSAQDAEQALSLIQNDEFDLVIADCVMPRMTGLELLKLIREFDPVLPIIIITGEPTAENQALSYKYKPQFIYQNL